jgi:NDP-sugar pyrophosphorylase family protein
MILAAGFGTRLRPLTNTIPKPLLPVAGRPLVLWNLLLLRQHGVREVVLNLHHLGHLIEKELGDGSRWGMRVTYSPEPVILGTGGGLKQAEPLFKGEAFLVMNGDTLLDLDVGALIRFHHERRALATMVVRDDPDVDAWGALELDHDHAIARINGQGRPPAGPSIKRMFAGVHVMHPRLLADVAAGKVSSIIDPYVRAIQRGEPVVGFTMRGYWSDVGTPERYAQAQREAEAGMIDLASRERAAS